MSERRKLWFDAPQPRKPVGYWYGEPIYDALELQRLERERQLRGQWYRLF
jgi:hypothetical protein